MSEYQYYEFQAIDRRLTEKEMQEEGGGEWIEAEGLLSSLLPVRNELARGDLRALYLGWLLCVQEGYWDDEQLEPPVPASLGALSRPLSNLAEFLRINPDLLSVAAVISPSVASNTSDLKERSAWVATLPPKEKDELLVRLMEGGDAHIGSELCARFRDSRSARAPIAEPQRRTVAELRAAAENREQTRLREEALKVAKENARREREAVLARERHLDAIAGRVSELWASVDKLIASKLPKNYDAAIKHLVDLRDLAVRRGTASEFANRIAAVREAQNRKPSFIDRLDRTGL